MRSIKLAVTFALIAATAVMAEEGSKVEFIIETGGDNHVAQYEAGQWPAYTPGVTDGSTVVSAGEDLNWAVRLLLHGQYNEAVPDDNRHADYDPVTFDPTGPGDFRYPLGAANVVFDLVITDMADNVIQIGHGGPGVAGFHSTINDGDADGARGQGGLNPDPLENAAFASAYTDLDLGGAGTGANGGRLIDPPSDGGPNMDYYWHPSANGLPAGSTAALGELVGFGAGYKDFDGGANYIAGVGMFGSLNIDGSNCGTGLVTDADNPQPLFEGQINTTGMGPPGQNDPPVMYKLKVIADATGNNILHGEVICDPLTFGPWGSFATKVNHVIVSETQFGVSYTAPATEVVSRLVFYNQSFYDGNKVAIDANPVTGANNDDDDAIDPTKSPLLPGAGIAQIGSWTGYIKGINGLMFDIKAPTGPITQGDFTFVSLGRVGTGNTPVSPSSFLVRSGQGVDGSDRVVVTFATGTSVDGWLQCTIGTGFGLPAPDVCYWGNARGETDDVSATHMLVNITDLLDVRDNQKPSPLNRPTVDEVYDNDKNGLTNVTDLLFVRDNQKTSPLNAVQRITR